VELLVPPLALFSHSTNTKMQDTVAKYISAFLKLISSLQQYYDALDKSHPSDTAFHFPYPCEYTPLESKKGSERRPFRYLRKLQPNKLVFLAKQEDDIICVKFVRRYSKEAHLHCASLDAAPALKGFESLPGGWSMVVMEYLDEKSYKPMSISYRTHIPALHAVIVQFHQAGFVHGDLRSSNILIRHKDGRNPIAILDFDWSGKDGKSRYPLGINVTTIRRPNGVRGGGLISADHDLEMVQFMNNDVKEIMPLTFDSESEL
jgi:serine/threonine protein kinase